MNGLDWLILVVLMLSALLAAAQGFFFEIISLAGAVFGYLLAAWGYGGIAGLVLPEVEAQAVAHPSGFFSIFFSFLLLAGGGGGSLSVVLPYSGVWRRGGRSVGCF